MLMQRLVLGRLHSGSPQLTLHAQLGISSSLPWGCASLLLSHLLALAGSASATLMHVEGTQPLTVWITTTLSLGVIKMLLFRKVTADMPSFHSRLAFSWTTLRFVAPAS